MYLLFYWTNEHTNERTYKRTALAHFSSNPPFSRGNDSSISNQIKEYLIHRTNKLKQDIYKNVAKSRAIVLQLHQRSSSSRKQKIIGVSPEPYIDLMSHQFIKRQWNHLSLGPSCIRLNQSAIRPRKQQEIHIKKEHTNIDQKVIHHLTSQPHNMPLKSRILKTYSDDLLTLEQAKTALSIQRKIKKSNLILRVTDKGHNFYIGSAIEFDKKVQKFFQDTNAFVVLKENPFNEILDKDDIPVRPIENTMRAPTTKISNFLDEIIRPIFDNKCSTTAIIDSTSLIKELDKYAKRGLLKSSTLFCTFDIRNLYTMLPQEEALNILVEFLHPHGYRKVKGIPLDAIRKLASIVLEENVCVYDKTIYKQMLGDAMGSSFTLTLANIFMWKWQKELVRRQDMTGEFYGRYIDDIFMTRNRSENDLKHLLKDANTWHTNIKLECKISKSLPFLDIILTNNNGMLTTSVYHKPAAEPYVVPFISDHPRHIFVNVIQTSLTRALRNSSTFEIFNNERINIKLTLLYNGYPSSFIEKQFRNFFSEYINSSSFLPFIDNETQFVTMRNKLLNLPTARQSQVSLSAATADIDNDQTDDTHQEPTRAAHEQNKQEHTYGNKLIVHYTHEQRFQTFKSDMHRVYDNVFKDTPVADVKLIVGNKNRRSSKNELICKRPKRSLLINKPFKKRQRKPKQSRKANISDPTNQQSSTLPTQNTSLQATPKIFKKRTQLIFILLLL
ncbi:unnamed protein product [Rotaria socialis]|uniref:Reverse transcriptase domain-containing protein n=1 Tax=Rotaria socialis TaxID=392032 RepID=A0A820WJZ5_9BILA|nr:unnamed protein product [Rotaria socialis]